MKESRVLSKEDMVTSEGSRLDLVQLQRTATLMGCKSRGVSEFRSKCRFESSSFRFTRGFYAVHVTCSRSYIHMTKLERDVKER
jgi:hypothetical protein